jgi:hypothetical protein
MMPSLVIARIVPPDDRAGGVRAFALTPYDLEILASEVHRWGPGVRLEVTVDGDDDVRAEVAAALAPIETSGVDLVVGLAAHRADGLQRFLDDVACGRRPRKVRPDATGRSDPPGGGGASGVACVRTGSDGRGAPCGPRTASARRARGMGGTHDRPTWKEDADVSSTPFGR